MSIIHVQSASFAQSLFLSWARPDLKCCMHVFEVIWLSYGHGWLGITNLKHIDPLPFRTKIVIDYIYIDYGPPIISHNRLWKFSDCPSLVSTERSYESPVSLGSKVMVMVKFTLNRRMDMVLVDSYITPPQNHPLNFVCCKGVKQGLQWIVSALNKTYLHVKCERLIIKIWSS